MFSPCCDKSVARIDLGDNAVSDRAWTCPECATSYKVAGTKMVKIGENRGEIKARTLTFRKVA